MHIALAKHLLTSAIGATIKENLDGSFYVESPTTQRTKTIDANGTSEISLGENGQPSTP